MANNQVIKDRVILGIDPGSNIMGYGVIHEKGKDLEIVGIGIIKMDKMDDHFVKIKHIFERTLQLIDGFKPDEVAIESPFQGKNVQSMLKLGRAQGAAISATLYRGLPIIEYAPRKVKLAITGSGAASKEQVAGMLQKIFKIDIQETFDATDGLAVALCHYYQRKSTISSEKCKNWKDYLKKKNSFS
ncbi:MAG: crossover junction endodeoxyribonuclease RuvC [Bacteroidales bacterium]|jgi:crossover junction endodeoxyribonuclease RuvC|nr:crossover junction endodeoxyribonuclease RuvC [Bacteroidales bacterium]